jgi:hypothetical protein
MTDNPNHLGNEVILECSKSNENDWNLEIVKYGNVDMIILINDKGGLHRPPPKSLGKFFYKQPSILFVDKVVDIKIIK